MVHWRQDGAKADHGLGAESLEHVQDEVGKTPPAQVWLGRGKQHQVVWHVLGHADHVPLGLGPDRFAPPRRGMADARASVGEGVERLGVDLRDTWGAEVVDQEAHGARGGEPGVDPAAKAYDGKRPSQVLCIEILEFPQIAVSVAHAAQYRTALYTQAHGA